MTALESTAAQSVPSNNTPANNTTTSSSPSDGADETGRTPEEYTRLGLWEVEPLYYSLSSSKPSSYSSTHENGRKKRGKAFKSRTEGEYKCFEAHDGVAYRPGDHVFVEIATTEPYVIGNIMMFKMVWFKEILQQKMRIFTFLSERKYFKNMRAKNILKTFDQFY